MITIKNKKEAVAKIEQMGLNHFPMAILDVKDIAGIEKFFKKYPAEEYILRNPNKADGNFYFVKDYEEALRVLKHFKKEVNINVSYNPYKEDIVLVGDIKIHRGSPDIVDLTARTDSDATQRNIYDNPQYNLHTSLEDDKLWDIPGFSKIARYISDHELYDVIVEFSVYDIKLGVNKENVVISELRTGF